VRRPVQSRRRGGSRILSPMKCSLIPLSTDRKCDFISLLRLRRDAPRIEVCLRLRRTIVLRICVRQSDLRQSGTSDECVIPRDVDACRCGRQILRAGGPQHGSVGAAISTAEGRCFILCDCRCVRSPAAAEQHVGLSAVGSQVTRKSHGPALGIPAPTDPRRSRWNGSWNTRASCQNLQFTSARELRKAFDALV
jgi:hypothetical protein